MKKVYLAIAIVLFFAFNADADVTHKVKKGDTISKISRKYSVSANEIKHLNSIRKTQKLRIGQTLIVRKTKPDTYTVKKGDNIFKIARRFNIDVDQLKDINLLDSSPLKVGQKLLLEAEPDIDVAYYKNLEDEIKQLSKSEDLVQMDTTDKLILLAKKLLNIPYRFGGNSIMGIDCSAYVQKVYGLIGIDLPRSARLQFNEGEVVDRDSLSIGDLVFFRTYASFPSHVGIYLGNDLFIHASSKGKKVSIDNLKTPYYFKRFIGGKRFIPENSEKVEKELEDLSGKS